MYDNDNVSYGMGINFKDIIIKIVLLVLFIVLLCWLFPKSADLQVFYDSVYRDNITAMKDAARNYYTVDKLPKNVGEQNSMTLKEMFDNHMLTKFTDKKGKTCDETSSKIEVTKLSETEYSLKVKLTCDSQDDYVLETIGCTNICSNGTCQTVINNSNNSTNAVIGDNSSSNNSNNGTGNTGNPTTTERDDTDYSQGYDPKTGEKITTILYQHRKAIVTTKTIYTCPLGYTKNGTKCIKEITGATIDATPVYNPDQTVTTDAKLNPGTEIIRTANPIKTEVGTEYSCPAGYTLNGSYCIKYTDATEIRGEVTYTCPSGYTKNGSQCTKSYSATYVPGATSYTCPNGGTLNGTTCTITTGASSNTTYTCPAGYSRNGSSCYKVYNATANTSYSCPSGWNRNGSQCTKTSTQTQAATASTTYSCPSGWNRSGSQCTKSSTQTQNASVSYGGWVNHGAQYYTTSGKAYTGNTAKLVLQGAISGATCGAPCGNKGIWYKYIYYTRSTSYTCPSGWNRSGSQCTKTSTQTQAATPSTTYSCPSGWNRNGSQCTKTSTQTQNATANTSYSCPNGGTRSGSTCTITASATPSTTYTCPSGYTRNGSQCVRTYGATPHQGTGDYTCPNGGTRNGTQCIITIAATPHQGEPTYTCPSGYTYNSTLKKCEYRESATATKKYSYTCPEGYTAEGEGENMKCTKVEKVQGTYYCEDKDAKLEGNKCTKTIKGTIKNYTCPEGYTLDGTKCTKQTTEVIDATVDTQTSTSYQYKWSESSYLEGWEFTGKTKTVSKTYTAGQK
ncbi:MAG TPA: hypothetical protein DCE23_06585 [Firmicutes bacterium]|nr:hypothetical protein [Bacillota bacterium]